MIVGIPKETDPGEKRAAVVPADVKKFVRLGATINVEAGLGEKAGFSDEEYREAGSTVLDIAMNYLRLLISSYASENQILTK